jgi:hypothetical protein
MRRSPRNIGKIRKKKLKKQNEKTGKNNNIPPLL